jgi:hypothetical protein
MQLTIDLLCPKSEWDWQGNDPKEAQIALAEHIKTCGAPVVLNIEIPPVKDLAGLLKFVGDLSS